MKQTTALLLLCAAISGCVSATATRTTGTTNGVTTTDSITTKAFLENISNGTYSNGSGMTLSVNSATPDQQSIATLAGGVVSLGTSAMALAAKAGTNAVVSPSTNSPAVKQ